MFRPARATSLAMPEGDAMSEESWYTDVADLIPPTSDIRRLERIWAMPDNANALDRLLAVVPTSFYEALAVGYRIRLLREAGMRPTPTTGRRG
jgi:hypothetical protein